MRVAIVHYHLRPGGVTKVIQNSLAALAAIADEERMAKTLRTLVIAGEPPSSDMPIPSYGIVEALGYNTSKNVPFQQVMRELETLVKQHLGGMPDIWHVHNHSLGKNLIIPEIVHHLAKTGQRVLLHMHDFPEDGRPDNYKFLREHLADGDPLTLGARLYPQGTHVQYALINQRDLNFLKASGVHDAQLHYLPNAVSMEEAEEPESLRPDLLPGRVFFYPARAIRRKNLGEFLLWAALADKDDRFAVARSPKNPLARPIYDEWVSFAQSLDLPVEFGVGERWQGDFATLLKSAYALITTSIAEGFGLAFLEPWLVMRPLVGRNLPEITGALEGGGVGLSSLYDRIDIPVEWIGPDHFRQEVEHELIKVFEAYGRTLRTDDVNRAVAAAVIDRYIDFGRLNEPLQKSVINRVIHSPSMKGEILPSKLETTHVQNATLQRNYEIVETHFNLHEYGKRLIQIYQAVASSKPESCDELNADVLLDQFLAPERFNLLRT